jgi:hypothetical protein
MIKSGMEPTQKTYNQCGHSFPANKEHFRTRSSNRGLEAVCKSCQRINARAFEQVRNKNGIRRVVGRRVRLRQFLDQTKLESGCVICGYNIHPAALDFDHLPGTNKVTTIAKLFSGLKEELLLEEIKKCEVVCANCHRVRTATRQQYTGKPPIPVDESILTKAVKLSIKRNTKKGTS